MHHDPIPEGHCQCGCGGLAPIATESRRGYVKGQPKRFIKGHDMRVRYADVPGRFWACVDRDGPAGCWLWTGTVNPDGYGRLGVGNRRVAAHRLSYELNVGPIPDGLVIDHLCRNPRCVNPAHLEPVPFRENVRRGVKGVLTTHCPSGHPYDEANTYVTTRGHRRCRICGRAEGRERYRAAHSNLNLIHD